MSEGSPENSAPVVPAAGGRRHRGRRIRRVLLGCLALLLIFHRPLLIALVHAAAVEVAARQNIRLSLDMDGTIFTNLSLRNILAQPNGRGPTPVEKISIGEVTVQYSIPSLLRGGVSEVLKSYTLRDATIIVKPVEGTSEQKSDLASTLHGLIQQPALFSDRVEIDNMNLVARVPDGDFAIEGLNLTLDPVRPGALGIALLQVPKVRTWRGLTAASSYVNRDLILSGLEIDPQILIQKFELDASQRARGINRLAVDGAIFGGSADFSLLVRELPGKHANNHHNALARVDSTIRDLSLEKLSQYFGGSAPAIGRLGTAAVHLTGDPGTPASWTGSITADAGAIRAGGAVLDRAGMRLDVSKGWATFSSTLFSGADSVTVQAEGKLPDSIDGFAGSSMDGWFNLAVSDPRRLSTAVTSGKVTGDGTFDLRENALHASAELKAASLSGTGLDVSSAEFNAHLVKRLPAQTGTGASPFDGLQAEIETSGSDLRAGAYAVDSVEARVSMRDGVAQLERLGFRRAQNVVTASGTYAPPRDMAGWQRAPGSFDFSVQAPSVAAFNAEPNLKGPDAYMHAEGALTTGTEGYGGAIAADVSEMRMGDFAARELNLKVTIQKNVARMDALNFALNATDGFSATGSAALQPPYAYDGAVRARIGDLSRFNALVPGAKGGLGGKLDLDWRGKGDLSTLKSSGQLTFAMKNGGVGSARGIDADIDGGYSPEGVDFPTFRVTSSLGAVSAVIAARNDVLRVRDIAISQAGRTLLSGSFALPLDLRTPARAETLIPEDGPVSADLVTGNIALDRFFPGGQAPVSGTGTVAITARGTIAAPDAHIVATGRGLRAKSAATLAPAALDADFTLLGSALSLKARVAQPSISPVEVAGTVPFPLKQILHDRQINRESPVQLSVRMRPSSLAFLTRLVPAVRFIQGNAGASVDVAGTLDKPLLSGAVSVDLTALRLSDPDMPSVTGFKADLPFAGNRLTFRQFGGNLSGGRFDVSGSVVFADLLNPAIDLHFVSKGDLILRNEAVTVRADSDVRVTGPLAAATVSGDIGITKSRFFKQIEILPLELPGRPAPQPPPAPPANIAIDTPPLRDWKFALKIHTKDPFVIQGNLANGAALIDLNLGGVGKAPTLEGTVSIENFVASLPFSKLRITNGYIYFTREDPFVPQLNIQAASNLQDYNVNVYIYGTAQDPKTVMSSEPPLPQEDIVALLATGATTSSLGSGNALAGRAAILVLQALYHKVFKAKATAPSDTQSFASRFKVDVGGVDPRTGQQEASSSFQLSDDLYLIGDVDVGGDIRGMVRYLIRFR